MAVSTFNPGLLGAGASGPNFAPLIAMFATDFSGSPAVQTGGLWTVNDLSKLYQLSNGTTPVTATSDPVGYIEDLSGNGNHMIQATAGNRPLYNSGTYPYSLFDGTNDFLRDTDIVRGTACTHIFAFQALSPFSTDYLFGSGATSDNGVVYQGGASPQLNMYATVVGPSTSAAALDADCVGFFEFNGASSRVRVGSGGYTTGNSGNPLAVGLTIGASYIGGNCMNMRLYGAMCIGRLLTTAEISAAMAVFGQLVGQTLS